MNSKRQRAKSLVLLGFVLLVIASATGSQNQPLATGSFIFQRADGVKVYYQLEIADTFDNRRQGLMWRESLAPRTGMLFDFENAQFIRMWMKNTLIPLDMLFLDEQGVILYIHGEAEPQSLTVIESPQRARYVVEINAGESGDMKLAIGDRLLSLVR